MTGTPKATELIHERDPSHPSDLGGAPHRDALQLEQLGREQDAQLPLQLLYGTAGREHQVFEMRNRYGVHRASPRHHEVGCMDGHSIPRGGASCYGAAARAPALSIAPDNRAREGECAAIVMGFNVHAGARIDGRDRPRVERVCRYLARPLRHWGQDRG